MESKVQNLNNNQDKLAKSMPTLDEIRNAIPSHCFEKNLALSIFYFLFDYVALISLFYTLPYVERITGWAGLLIW